MCLKSGNVVHWCIAQLVVAILAFIGVVLQAAGAVAVDVVQESGNTLPRSLDLSDVGFWLPLLILIIMDMLSPILGILGALRGYRNLLLSYMGINSVFGVVSILLAIALLIYGGVDDLFDSDTFVAFIVITELVLGIMTALFWGGFCAAYWRVDDLDNPFE